MATAIFQSITTSLHCCGRQELVSLPSGRPKPKHTGNDTQRCTLRGPVLAMLLHNKLDCCSSTGSHSIIQTAETILRPEPTNSQKYVRLNHHYHRHCHFSRLAISSPLGLRQQEEQQRCHHSRWFAPASAAWLPGPCSGPLTPTLLLPPGLSIGRLDIVAAALLPCWPCCFTPSSST